MKYLSFLLALLFLIMPVGASAAQSFGLGMNILWAGGDISKLEKSFQRMQNMGITHARTDWEWRSVEAVQGKYDWTKTDQLVQLASKYRITLLPIVHYAPEWALPEDEKPAGIFELAPKASAYTAYAKFLNASIDRYGPNGTFEATPITHWQVWNEPNIKEFWYFETGKFWSGWNQVDSAKQYVQLLQAVNEQLGARRATVKIVHAGLSKSDITYMWYLWDSNPDYGNLFDIMAVHSYFFDPDGGVRDVNEVDANNKDYAALGFIGSDDDHGFLPKVYNIQLFLKLKKSPKPIWITEIGFMANKTGPTKENPYILPESEVAELAEETLAYIANRLTSEPFGMGVQGETTAANVQRVYWFMLDDYVFPHDMGNFGVYRADGTPREALKQSILHYR